MKPRKAAALILVLALFALPALCLGEAGPSFEKAYEAGRGVKAAVTFKPGQALERNPAMAQLCGLLKALRVETYLQKQNDTILCNTKLFVQDKPSLSLTFIKEAEEFHILSSLLEDQMLSFTPKGYDNLFEFDLQSLQNDLAAPLSLWFTEISSDAKTSAGTFESGRHDTAVKQTVYTLSADRISSFLTIIAGWASQDMNLDRILAIAATPLAGDIAASKERVRKAILAMPKAFLEAAGPALSEPATLTVWLGADGIMKAAELKARFSGYVLVAGQYVQTRPDGVTTQYSLNISPEEARKTDDVSTMFGMIAPAADSLSLSFAKTDTPAETKGEETIQNSRWRFSCAVKGSGTELGGIGLNFTGTILTSARSAQKDWTMNINARPYFGAALVCREKSVPSSTDTETSGTLDLYYLPGISPTCTAAYTVSTGEPEALPALPKENVHLDKMNPDELYAWWQETYPAVMGKLAGVMEGLPDLSNINGP